MDDDLEGLTLANWAAGIWYKHCRGVPLNGHEAAIVYCMEHHQEWRARWDALGESKDPELSRDVLHVHYDALVKMQVDGNDPPEIRECFEKLREREFTEFDALHTIVPALSETLWAAKTKNQPFDNASYTQLAQQYVRVAILRPASRRKHDR
jgi:hypothetical protein